MLSAGACIFFAIISNCLCPMSTLRNSAACPCIHTGCGVVCSGKRGVIKANQYITKYLGEIYPPWKWVEKEREEERQRFVLCALA